MRESIHLSGRLGSRSPLSSPGFAIGPIHQRAYAGLPSPSPAPLPVLRFVLSSSVIRRSDIRPALESRLTAVMRQSATASGTYTGPRSTVLLALALQTCTGAVFTSELRVWRQRQPIPVYFAARTREAKPRPCRKGGGRRIAASASEPRSPRRQNIDSIDSGVLPATVTQFRRMQPSTWSSERRGSIIR